jgi:hypothetical protein
VETVLVNTSTHSGLSTSSLIALLPTTVAALSFLASPRIQKCPFCTI